MKTRGLVLCGVLAAVSGCSSKDEVDIGDENAAKTGERLSDYADVWEGYAEAYEFADGSDKLRIVLDAEGNGSLVVGDSAEPVVDAEHPWRPGQDGLVPGFRYTVRAASVAASRLTFSAQRSESFADFCELQTPFPADPRMPDAYFCVPRGENGFDDKDTCWIRVEGEEKRYLDCALYEACTGTCQCTSTGCGIPQRSTDDSGYFSQMDASLTDGGDVLTGTFVPWAEVRVTVRLERQ